MLKCCIRLSEVPLHLYQITAGFELLKRAGKIELEIERLKPNSPHRLPYNMIEAEYNGKTIIFDMNDGYDNLLNKHEDFISFYNKILKKCDILIKRSYREDLNSRLENPGKIMETAPNYFVTVKANPAHIPVPCDPKKEAIKKTIRLLPISQYYNGLCFEENFREPPKINPEPRILFMARLWDPKGDFNGQLTAEKSEERRAINENRANCIRLCRKEFGNRFSGGVTPSAFSFKEYPDLVLEKPKTGEKGEYLKRMKSFDIHIATAGLHKSTGWKFAEYIAASKAIVTEPLYYASAGNLADSRNYLSFNNKSECCERITEIFDEQKRYEMMRANFEYYNEWMSCEKLVSHALKMC